jgi:hypothetical protein
MRSQLFAVAGLACLVVLLLVATSCGTSTAHTVTHGATTPAATRAATASPTRSGSPGGCDRATQWHPPADNVAFNALAMVAPDEGWVVGQTNPYPFVSPPGPTGIIYHLVHGQLVRLAPEYPGIELTALSIGSPTDGWAAGMNNGGSGMAALVLHYHRGQWSPVDIPAVHSAVDVGPASISIQMVGPDAGWMFAWIGIPLDPKNPASRSQVAILRYQQGVWTPIAAPVVSATTQLYALSAVAADEAWMVGTDYANNVTTPTLFAHYHNGAWSLWPQQFPGVTEIFTMLSPTDGWAFADVALPTPGILVLHYDSTRWAPVATPAEWVSHDVQLTDQVFVPHAGITWFSAYTGSAYDEQGADLLEQYAGGAWQHVAWLFANVDPVAIATSSFAALWGIGDISHQEGCAPALVTDVNQGVLLHLQQGQWNEQILP